MLITVLTYLTGDTFFRCEVLHCFMHCILRIVSQHTPHLILNPSTEVSSGTWASPEHGNDWTV
jgi:hypothetical protein